MAMDKTQTSPTIKSLSSREANKDARAAFNQTALMLAALPDGRFAICDRIQSVYMILDDPPTREQFQLYSQLLSVSRLAAAASYYGEPDTKQLARDLRSSRQPTVIPRTKNEVPTLDIEI